MITLEAFRTKEKRFSLDAVNMKFIKAYASLNRLEGRCRVITAWQKKRVKRCYEIQEFELCFKRDGVKDYRVKKVFGLGKNILNDIDLKQYVELSLLEAALLIQDAYQQNVVNYIKTADDFIKDHFILQYDTKDVERNILLKKLTPQRLSATMCANIYLSALRGMDRALLYDMSTMKRQNILGDRAAYLSQDNSSYRKYSFLCSKVNEVKRVDSGFLISAIIIFCTEKDAIVKQHYNMTITTNNNIYMVDEFYQTKRELLDKNNEENPLNYYVYCLSYHVKDAFKIRDWLNNKNEVFLSGDFENGCSYKWLKDNEESWQDFSITNKIFCEFIITGNTFLVFAPKAHDTIKIRNILDRELKTIISGGKKHYLTIKELYNMVFKEEKLADKIYKYRAKSSIVYSQDLLNTIKSIYPYPTICKMEKDVMYYFITINDGTSCAKIMEIFVAKNWGVINVFKGDIEEETKQLINGNDNEIIVYDYEWENRFDLFNPSISDARKWIISKNIGKLNRDLPVFHEMGIIPTLKDVIVNFETIMKGYKLENKSKIEIM